LWELICRSDELKEAGGDNLLKNNNNLANVRLMSIVRMFLNKE